MSETSVGNAPIGHSSDLSGRVALVTGAGQGNGRAIALRLAVQGADVSVNDIREETAEATAAEIRALGCKSAALVANVAQLAQIDALISAVVDQFGRLDVLVNNAGLIAPRPFGEVTEEDWDSTFA